MRPITKCLDEVRSSELASAHASTGVGPHGSTATSAAISADRWTSP